MISVRDVRKTYGKNVEVLKDVSITAERGEFVVIMGSSGSGKSTLLNLIGCLDRPSSGTITVEGRAIHQLNDREASHFRNKHIGFVFQSFHLIPRLTLVENVMLPLLYAREFPRDGRDRAVALLGDLGLGHRLTHLPGRVSGGEQQRASIARALVNEPSVLLADEPTGNLDVDSGADVLDILKRLTTKGLTVVLVTHDPGVGELAQSLYHMRNGALSRE